MKKFLSLVLALVMTMSLVTISAGAKDFTDDSKINYEEAVDVMSALKVIDGYADGSFNPQGSLTRGAAAKIICNLILGPTTASALSADTAPYKDVPTNHTFAGYIAYCQQQGIISGYADGTFRPAATLTNYAFLKMLLGALGYDAQIEGYVGDNWSIQVAKQALATGLTKGLKTELNGTDYATREQACLYALNTLKATMVDYEAKITASVNGAQVVVGNSVANDVAWNIASKTDGNIKDDEYVQFAEKYFANLELEITNGMYGRPANTWKLKKSEIGTYTSIDPTYVLTEGTKEKDVYKEIGKAICDEDDYEWEYFRNGESVQGDVPDSKSTDEYAFTGDGAVTEIYVEESYDKDEPGKVTVVEINYYLGQVSKVKEEKDGETITVKALSKEPKLDDRTFAIEGFEEDDYVVFTVDYVEDDEDFVIGEVIEPDTVTGDVVRVDKDKTSEKSYLKLADGEKYTYSEYQNPAEKKNTFTHLVYDVEETPFVNVHPELNEEYTLFLDPNGFVLGFKKGADETKYLYVLDSDEELRDWVAKVVLADATQPKVDLKDDLKKVPAGFVGGDDINWIANGKVTVADKEFTNVDELIWKYTVSDSGVYTLTYVEDAVYPDAKYEINNGKAYIDPEDTNTGDAEGLIVDKDTVFDDVDNEKAYVGYDEVPNVSEAKIAYVLKKGVVEIMFILDGEIYDKNSTYFFLADDGRSTTKYDGDNYWTLEDAYVNGYNEELNVQYGALVKEDIDPATRISKDCELSVGVLYKAVKSINEGDTTYITKVEKVDTADDYIGDPVAVGKDSFQIKSTTTANKVKFTCDNETSFVVVESLYEKKLNKDNEYVFDKYSVYAGDVNDMFIGIDDEDYFCTVEVVERDKTYAELVYIYLTKINPADKEEIENAEKLDAAAAALTDVVLPSAKENYSVDADMVVKALKKVDGVTYTAALKGDWDLAEAGKEDTHTSTWTITMTLDGETKTEEIEVSYTNTSLTALKKAVDAVPANVTVEASATDDLGANAKKAIEDELSQEGFTVEATISGDVDGSEGDVVTKSVTVKITDEKANEASVKVIATIIVTA